MLDIMVRMYGTSSICLGKLSFDQMFGKTDRKLSTNHIASFSNAVTSKPFDHFLKC